MELWCLVPQQLSWLCATPGVSSFSFLAVTLAFGKHLWNTGRLTGWCVSAQSVLSRCLAQIPGLIFALVGTQRSERLGWKVLGETPREILFIDNWAHLFECLDIKDPRFIQGMERQRWLLASLFTLKSYGKMMGLFQLLSHVMTGWRWHIINGGFRLMSCIVLPLYAEINN